MAKTPEGKVKDAVKKLFKKYGVYYFMPVQNGMGAPALDFYCCVRGRFLAVETKANGKKMTPRQEQTALQITSSLGSVIVVDDINGASFNSLEAMLQSWTRQK